MQIASRITVVETLQAMRGKGAELRKALAEIVPICRKEKGCLQYDLLDPVEGEEQFLVLMKWESMEDLRRHEASSHIQAFVSKYDQILYGEVTQTEWKSP